MQDNAILSQSKAAIKQWGEQWREHAKIHFKTSHTTFEKFENIGVGKAVLCVANGYSFEENIETIQKHHKNVDIMACDKTMGNLFDHGVTPDYVLVCDANVDYKKYMEKWKDKLNKTTLFINVCANPEWSQNGNWKDVVFFVNKDIIDSHLEFSKLSGCTNFICAGTNVSNAMVILLTQCDNEARNNLFGYDRILLIGYDYSWKFNGKYYAFDEDGGGKASYMKHAYVVAPSGEECYTSGNLQFSMDWLKKYITHFKLPIIQCSKSALLMTGPSTSLDIQMQYRYKTIDREPVREKVKELKRIDRRRMQLLQEINNIGRDHYRHAQTI